MTSKREVVRMWECGACNELHKFEHQAEQCCAPEISECWLCPVCDKAHDDKKDAEHCCPDAEQAITCPSCLRDHDLDELSFHAVKIAGHCTECNPMFTVDQQIAIQDLHYLGTGKSRNLLA